MAGFVRRAALAGVLALALSVGAETAQAQADFLGPGAGFISVGAQGIDTGELESFLDARGYPTFGRTAVTVGLGAYRILSSGVMLSGEFNGLIIGEEEHGGGDVGLGGGYVTLGVGYAVNLSPRARIYPRLGVGVGGMGLWVNQEDTVAFEDVLSGRTPIPLREPVLSRDGVVFDLGAGAEILPGGRRGPLIGVRAGYLAAPFSSDWDAYELTATGGPDSSISGPYARLTVGWAWRR
jgi:hypothetical protein